MRKARSADLIDLLEQYEGVAHDGPVWRVSREGRDPIQGHASGGRWDPGSFDVLYTSLESAGAVAEVHFHLNQQPVFPSKLIFFLSQIQVKTKNTLRLVPADLFSRFDIDQATFGSTSNSLCQEIGDAARFMGFDGLLVPSARSDVTNLVLFTEDIAPSDIEVIESSPLDWGQYK